MCECAALSASALCISPGHGLSLCEHLPRACLVYAFWRPGQMSIPVPTPPRRHAVRMMRCPAPWWLTKDRPQRQHRAGPTEQDQQHRTTAHDSARRQATQAGGPGETHRGTTGTTAWDSCEQARTGGNRQAGIGEHERTRTGMGRTWVRNRGRLTRAASSGARPTGDHGVRPRCQERVLRGVPSRTGHRSPAMPDVPGVPCRQSPMSRRETASEPEEESPS